MAFTGACPRHPLNVKVGPPERIVTDRIHVRGFYACIASDTE